MVTWLLKILATMPWWGKALASIVLASAFIGLLNQVSSCSYHRGSADYHEKEAEWKTERTALITRAEEAEKEAASLKPQLAAIAQTIEDRKRLDRQKLAAINQVTEELKREEANTSLTVDCFTRARRTADKYRAVGIDLSYEQVVRDLKCSGQ